MMKEPHECKEVQRKREEVARELRLPERQTVEHEKQERDWRDAKYHDQSTCGVGLTDIQLAKMYSREQNGDGDDDDNKQKKKRKERRITGGAGVGEYAKFARWA
jgi:hypothetical protein